MVVLSKTNEVKHMSNNATAVVSATAQSGGNGIRSAQQTKSNVITDFIGELDKLIEQRKAWEAGAYKTSTDELYSMLACCLDKLLQLRGSDSKQAKQRRLLNERLKAAGLAFRESTPLATKIVRYVFGSDRRRSHTYARAIISAVEHKKDGLTFASWVREQGGIEEVKRKAKTGLSPKDIEERQRELAEQHLHVKKALVSFKSVKELRPSAENSTQFSYAIIRTDTDGKASVVFGDSHPSVIKMLLSRAGKLIEQQDAQQEKQSQERQRKEAREAAVSAAI